MTCFRLFAAGWVLVLAFACGTEVKREPGTECALQLLLHTPSEQDAFAQVDELQIILELPGDESVVRRIDPSSTEFVLASSPVTGASLFVEGLDGAGQSIASGRSGSFDLTPSVPAEVHVLFARRGEFARLRGDLGSPRFGHSMTTLPDGRVLVFGGASGGGPDAPENLVRPEIYDPQLQRSCAGMDEGCPLFEGGDLRFGHSATRTAQDKVFLFGGFDDSGLLERSVLLFEAEADGFRRLQNLDPERVTARAHHAAAGLNVLDSQTQELRDSILLIGGLVDEGAVYEPSDTGLLFDTRTETFTRTDLQMDYARSHARATAFGPNLDQVLISGGDNLDGPVGPVELFTGQGFSDWTSSGSGASATLHTARRNHVALAFDGGVLVLGGDDGLNSLDAPELFFFQGGLGTGMFSLGVAVAPPAHVGLRGQLAASLDGGRVMLVGGEQLVDGDSSLSAGVEILQRQAGSKEVVFSELPSLDVPRAYAAWCVLPGGGILLAGGLTEGGTGPVASGEVWYYNP